MIHTPIYDRLSKFKNKVKANVVSFELNDFDNPYRFSKILTIKATRRNKFLIQRVVVSDFPEEDILDYTAETMRAMLDRAKKPKE